MSDAFTAWKRDERSDTPVADKLLQACEAALEALRGAVTEHGRICAIKEGGACDCWLPLRRRAIDQLEDAIHAAQAPKNAAK